MKTYKHLFIAFLGIICVFLGFACGKVDEEESEENNKVINSEDVIESALEKLTFENFQNISINLNGFDVMYREEYSYYSYEYDVDIQNINMNFSLDDNNKLVGNGKGTVIVNEANSNMQGEAQLHISDGFVYVMVETKQDDIVDMTKYFKINIKDAILNELEIDCDRVEGSNTTSFDNLLKYYAEEIGITSLDTIEKLLNVLKDWYEQNFSSIIESVKNSCSLDFSKILTEVILMFFDVEAVEGGYTLKLKEVNPDINKVIDLTVYDVLESVVGEKILNNIDLVLEFNVDKLIKFVESKGLIIADLVKSIDALLQVLYDDSTITLSSLLGLVFDMEDFNILEFLNSEEVRGISVAFLIEQYTKYSKDEIKVIIADYLNQAKEIKLGDLINKYIGGKDEINEVISILSTAKPNLTIHLNNDCELTKVVNNLNVTDEENRMPFEMVGEIEYLFNQEELLDLSSLKTTIDAFYIKFNKGLNIEKTFENNFNDYEFEETNDKYILSRTEEFEGSYYEFGKRVLLTEKEDYTIEIYKNDINSNNNFMYEVDCNGFYKVNLSVPSYNSYSESKTYKATILDYDYDSGEYIVKVEDELEGKVYYENSYEYYDYENLEVFFNPKTGAYIYNVEDYYTLHDYTIDESKSVYSDKCLEYSKHYYKCSNCQNFYVDYCCKNEHDNYLIDYELYGETCNDGFKYTLGCKKCDNYKYEDEDHYHRYFYHYYELQEFGYKLDDQIIYHSCPCGYYSEIYLPNSRNDYVSRVDYKYLEDNEELKQFNIEVQEYKYAEAFVSYVNINNPNDIELIGLSNLYINLDKESYNLYYSFRELINNIYDMEVKLTYMNLIDTLSKEKNEDGYIAITENNYVYIADLLNIYSEYASISLENLLINALYKKNVPNGSTEVVFNYVVVSYDEYYEYDGESYVRHCKKYYFGNVSLDNYENAELVIVY